MRALQIAFGGDASVLRESGFQVLLLASLFPVLGTALVSPILDSLIDPFGISPENIGLMISLMTAPAIVIIPLSGAFADRFGRKPILIVALIFFGAGGTGITITSDFEFALGLRVLQGIGFGGIVPIITASVGDLFDGDKEIAGQGFRVMGNGISGAVFPLFSGILVGLAWQYPFFLYAASFPIALAVYLWFVEPAAASSKTSDSIGLSRYYIGLLNFVSHLHVFALLIGRTLPIVAWIGFLTYNSLIVVRVMDGSPFQAGLLVAIGNLIFAGGASQVSRIRSWFQGKFYSLVVANLLLVVGFIGFFLAPQVDFAVPGIALAGVGFGITISMYRSYLTELAPEHLRAGIVSLGAAGARVTATLTPIMMGMVIDILTPVFGQISAIQIAGICSAIIGGMGGIVCLTIVSVSDPVALDSEYYSQ